MLEGCVPWPEDFVKEYKQKKYWEDIPLGEHFDKWVAQYADRPAILYKGEEVSYQEMGTYVTRLAYHLTQMGVKTYDPVIFQLLNTPELIYLLYACFKIGAIPVCSLPLHRWTEISYFAEKVNARVHAIPGSSAMGFDFGTFAKKVKASHPNIKHILTVGETDDPELVSINTLMHMDVDPEHAQKVLEQHRPDPMAPAVFQLSGGTTGVPKLIPRTHNDYHYNARCDAEALGFDENERVLQSAPLMHNAGMICGLIPIHLAGGAIAPCPPKTEAILQGIHDNRVTSAGMVPVFIHTLLDVPDEELEKYDLSTFKLLSWGGNPVLPEVQMRFREKFQVDSIQVYGMAEGLICWTRIEDPLETKLNTQGRPISEADEVRVVDINTAQALPANEIGECWVRGPYTIRGYYKAEEHNQNAFTHEGFYRTGDLIKKDHDGNIIVMGRIKDCISRGAEKVNAEEVESHIGKYHKVKAAAVVGMPDEVYGERICAFAVPMEGESFTLEELSEFLLKERQIAKFKLPERLEIIDELPISAVGKFEKKSLGKKIKAILKDEGKYYGEVEKYIKRVSTVVEAFEQIPRIFDADAAEGVEEVFQFFITGDQKGEWHIKVKEKKCQLSQGVHTNPTISLTLEDKDFMALRCGDTDGRTLLMEGRLKADGNIMAATLIPTLFPVD